MTNSSSGSGRGPVLRFPGADRLPNIPFVPIVLALAVLALAFASFYTVAPEETGVILRFGRFAGTSPPAST